MPYEPIIPKGQHLGTAHEVDDAVVGHLFEDGTNKLKGHAAWRRVDDDDREPVYTASDEYERPRELTQEERELAAKIAGVILIGLEQAFIAAKPHVMHWWNEKAAPAMRSVLKRVAQPRKAKKQVANTPATSVSHAKFVASTPGVELAVREPMTSMSSAEWAYRYRAMLAAGTFKDEQLRILFNARIEDRDSALEAQSEAKQLTPQQFADRIRLMLEANPSLLDTETSAELIRTFGAEHNPANDPGRAQLGA